MTRTHRKQRKTFLRNNNNNKLILGTKGKFTRCKEFIQPFFYDNRLRVPPPTENQIKGKKSGNN